MENKEFAKQIFNEELLKLWGKGFISEIEFLNMIEAYNKYCLSEEIGAKKLEEMHKPHAAETVKEKNSENKQEKKTLSQPYIHILTPEEIRERNITWSLNLGVLFILIAGLVIATSNWSIMSNITKTVLILLVSILFFIISYFADKILKIIKTSFAFWIMGSLLLPVSILSLGFFKLFGEWLSITGEGRFVLGLAGAVICLPVYIYSTYKYQHRAFAWISLINLSLGIIFALKAIRLPLDAFFLGIVIYNAILMLSFIRLKDNKTVELFAKELDNFTQVNLILSTVFILFFYKNHFFYGFNLILMSIIYVFMLYYGKRKEFSFAFSILLVYGLYQIIEHTFLVPIDFLAFATIGFIFVAVGRIFKDDASVKRIFDYISGFVSFCAFTNMIIAYFHIYSKTTSPLILTAAYFLVFTNYLVLSNVTGDKLFRYAAPIFLIASGDQSYLIFKPYLAEWVRAAYLLLVPLCTFLILYYFNKWKYFNIIRQSTAVVAFADLFLKIAQALLREEFLKCSIYFYVFAAMLFLVYLLSKGSLLSRIIRWAIPAALLAGSGILYERIDNLIGNSFKYTFSLHIWICIVILIIISMGLYKCDEELEEAFFWSANAVLPLSVAALVIFYNKPAILIATILVYIYGLFKSKLDWQKILFMSAAFIVVTLSIESIMEILKMPSDYRRYILCITSVIISILWFSVKNKSQKWLFLNLIPYSTLGILVLAAGYDYTWTAFFVSVLLALVLLYVIQASGETLVNVLPLMLISLSVYSLNRIVFSDPKMLLIYLIFVILLALAGWIKYKKLYDLNSNGTEILGTIDWYTFFALINTFAMYNYIHNGSTLYLKLIPAVIIVVLAFMQINRVDEPEHVKIFETLAFLSTVIPYYTLIYSIHIPQVIYTEIMIFPIIPLMIILSRKIWKDGEKSLEAVEYIVLIFVSAVLLMESTSSGDIRDGIILGIASLMSVIFGMQLRIKTFFFTGCVTLLLNLIIQTRSFWGNLPWWSYLLIVGTILILIASINERQNSVKNQEKKFDKDKIKNWFKSWK